MAPCAGFMTCQAESVEMASTTILYSLPDLPVHHALVLRLAPFDACFCRDSSMLGTKNDQRHIKQSEGWQIHGLVPDRYGYTQFQGENNPAFA